MTHPCRIVGSGHGIVLPGKWPVRFAEGAIWIFKVKAYMLLLMLRGWRRENMHLSTALAEILLLGL